MPLGVLNSTILVTGPFPVFPMSKGPMWVHAELSDVGGGLGLA